MASVKHNQSFTIDRPIDVIFPLLSPEGEKAWVPGWDYENMSGSTHLHEDYVFLTKSHDHGTTQAVWIVKQYDPENYFIQFYKVEPGDKLGIVSVQCTKKDDSVTQTEVIYEYIGLSEKGNQFISQYTKEKHNVFIMEWKSLLESYFKNKK